MNKNKEILIDLILQVLDEPRLIYGAYSRFAKVFSEHSGKKCTRSQISQWLEKGVPPKKIGFLESLSKIHAKNKKSVITAEKLRPDLFRHTKSKSAYLHGLVEINFAGITFIGNNLMFKLFLSAIASVKLAPVAINGIIKPVSNITYRSNDESILAVDEFGNVVAVGYGKASIHITANVDDGLIEETVEIEVSPDFTIALNPSLQIHEVPRIDTGATSDSPDIASSEDIDTAGEEVVTPAETPQVTPIEQPSISEGTTLSVNSESIDQPVEQLQEVAGVGA